MQFLICYFFCLILLLQVVGGATGDDVVEFLDWDIRSPSSRNNLSDDTPAHCVFIFFVYVGEERKHYSSCEGLIYQCNSAIFVCSWVSKQKNPYQKIRFFGTRQLSKLKSLRQCNASELSINLI